MINTDGEKTICNGKGYSMKDLEEIALKEVADKKIKENRAKEETAMVAVELYKTLGFCHGFLGKDKWSEIIAMDFPWPEDVKTECWIAYKEEYSLGKELAEND